MMKPVLILIFVFFSLSPIAQEPEIGISNRGIRPMSSINTNSNSGNIKGDIYLESEWKETKLTFIDSEKTHKYPARFNLNLDIIEVKVFTNTYAISWSDLIEAQIITENRIFVPLANENTFAEVIYQKESIRLLKTFSLKLKKANYNPSLNTGQKEDEWIKDTTLFLDFSGEVTEIKRKKDVLKALEKSTYKNKKPNNMASVSETDLIELINFLLDN